MREFAEKPGQMMEGGVSMGGSAVADGLPAGRRGRAMLVVLLDVKCEELPLSRSQGKDGAV